MKVAVIGPEDLVQIILEVGQEYPNLQMFPAAYQHIEETAVLVEQFKAEVDLLLFAGPIPYHIARLQDGETPMVYVQYTGTALYRVLFQLMRDAYLKNSGQNLRLSIDVLPGAEVRERLEELEISLQDLFVKEYQIGQKSAEIHEFHLKLWENQRIDAIITCVTSVYENLKKLGIPCYRIIPIRSAIHEALRMVELEGKSLKMRDTQLVISIISIGGWGGGNNLSEYTLQKKKLEIQQILLSLGERTRKLIYRSDGNKLMFVTTRGVIEEITNKFTEFPLFDVIQERLELPVNMGIGIGYTAGEAENNAEEALRKAETTGGGSCYAVLQNGAVFGPLGRQFQMAYSVRSDDPARLAAAKAAGLSVGTINKLWALNEQLLNSTVTAGELAKWFDITLRSARRILSKLEENGLAVVVGEEQPVNKGRPRRLYTLRFPAAKAQQTGGLVKQAERTGE